MKNEKLENNLQNMEGEIDGQRGYIVIILTSLDFRDGPILRRPVAVLLPSFCKTKKKQNQNNSISIKLNGTG